MLGTLKKLGHGLGRRYVDKLTADDYTTQRFRRHNERPIEFRFVFESLTFIRPHTVLDVGSGTTALPHMIANCGCVVTAIDNVRDYWPAGMFNRHWKVIDDDILKPKIKGQFDLVCCISVIEHIVDHETAFRNMVSLVKPGGHLVLTTPYSEHNPVPNVYALDGAAYGGDLPYICRSSARADLDAWLKSTDVQIVAQEYWRLWLGAVWTQGRFLDVPERVDVTQPHQLSCILFGRNGGQSGGMNCVPRRLT